MIRPAAWPTAAAWARRNAAGPGAAHHSDIVTRADGRSVRSLLPLRRHRLWALRERTENNQVRDGVLHVTASFANRRRARPHRHLLVAGVCSIAATCRFRLPPRRTTPCSRERFKIKRVICATQASTWCRCHHPVALDLVGMALIEL